MLSHLLHIVHNRPDSRCPLLDYQSVYVAIWEERRKCAKAEKDSIVGDPLALWAFEDPKHPRYLVDGMEGGMTLVGTFEKEVGVVTYRDGVLLVATSLIATREYVEAQAR